MNVVALAKHSDLGVVGDSVQVVKSIIAEVAALRRRAEARAN
jgi:hypothetical protein